jgi:carbamoyl-phosphate synthase large subunit
VELINCFRRAAQELEYDLEVITIDMDPLWSPACQVADYTYKVPRCTSPDFLKKVLGICKKHHVDLIIPTIDTELIGYTENSDLFLENGTEILISSEEFVRMTRDKEMTARLLKENGIPTPRTWSLRSALNDLQNLKFPLFMKPRDGSCSNGASIVDSQDELIKKDEDKDLYIIQEFFRDKEYTVNCFYDRSKGCVSCVPHFRKFVRAGEVCFAETLRVPEFRRIADRLFEVFPGIYGCICFQGFLDDTDHASLFEINARFGGGYPICDRAGGTFAKWILQNLCGEVPDYHDNWREGLRMLRYDSAVFIE